MRNSDPLLLNTKKQLKSTLLMSKTTLIDMMKRVWSKNFSSMKYRLSSLIFKVRTFKELLSKLIRLVNCWMNTTILRIWIQKRISQWFTLIIQSHSLLFSNLMLIRKLKFLQISFESCLNLVLWLSEIQLLLLKFKDFELMKKLKDQSFDHLKELNKKRRFYLDLRAQTQCSKRRFLSIKMKLFETS